MKLAILLSAIATATAFAPVQIGQASTALASTKSDFAGEIGVVAPLGVWDPTSHLEKGQDEFERLRALELKHGRVCMLGVVGYLTTYAGIRLPGLEDVPAGWAAWGIRGGWATGADGRWCGEVVRLDGKAAPWRHAGAARR